MSAGPRSMHFDGPCPFLFCLEDRAHTHPICPSCGAVRYGNPFCAECQRHEGELREELDQAFS